VKDAFSNPEHIVGLLMRIERGEFDAKSPAISQWQLEQYNIAHEKALSEKDAEIARLKGVVRRLDSLNTALCCTQGKLGDRIAQQDQELKDLTGRIKALDGWKRTNATYGSPGWSATVSAFNEGIDRAIEVMHGNVPMSPESGNVILGSEPPKDEPEPALCSNCNGTGVEHSYWSEGNFSGMSSGTCRICKGTGQKPIQKEPELVICTDAPKCPADICGAKTPHRKMDSCKEADCALGKRSGPCIPYKKEPTVPQEPDRPCQACIEGNAPHCSKPFPDCPYYGDPEPVPKDGAALAKDIGDLTLRLDKIERDAEILKDSFVVPHGLEIANAVTRVSQLEKHLNDHLLGRDPLEERIGALEKKVK
jgi:hypothetical protein